MPSASADHGGPGGVPRADLDVGQRKVGGVVWVTCGDLAGAAGIEPAIAGSKPAALPLGYAPESRGQYPKSFARAICRCELMFLTVPGWIVYHA